MKRIPLNLLGVLAVWSALNIHVSTTYAQFITFTNPAPAAGDWFGYSVAAVGTDRVLIGAPHDDMGATDAGAAYLFGTNGALLTTFTNPAPTTSDVFGSSVAAVGVDAVLIGAPSDDTGAVNAGAAYLFSTNGGLLTTFTNPVPETNDFFGCCVSAVGIDRLLIGANGDDSGATDAGAAYLYGTNGALLTTFTNPHPATNDWFGYSVAVLGTDRVVIGACYADAGATDAGVVFLFSTNGTLLMNFTNPTPEVGDRFGRSVATLGTDRVLVQADRDNTGAKNAGAAYLFNTNATLLTTFTNPTPAADDYFGQAVAVGTDRVLITADDDDTGAFNAGAVCLFSTNGTLLTVLTNPMPAAGEYFGTSVAALGTNRIIVGARSDAVGTYFSAGAAYLFSVESFVLETPSLSIALNPQHATTTLSWSMAVESWVLEYTNILPFAEMASWPQVPPPYETNAGTISVTFTNPPATEHRFFRLHKQ